jgi:hypothetical protein
MNERRLVFKPTVRGWRPGDLGPRGTWRTDVRFDSGAQTTLYHQTSAGAFDYMRGVLDRYCPRRHVDPEGRDWTPLFSPAVVRDEIARPGGAS